VKIIKGKEVAEKIEEEIKERLTKLKEKVKIGAIGIKEDEGMISYIQSIERIATKLGVKVDIRLVSKEVETEELVREVERFNKNKEVDGIIIGRPLPKHINENRVIETLSPFKDIDCLHPINLGYLFLGEPVVTPCTPQAVLEILNYEGIEIRGKRIIIVGRSNIVGKPLYLMLAKKGVDGTVTLCHTKTKELKEYTKNAEILIVACGNPKMITKEMVKEGVIVIDVGINVVNGKLVGDVDFEEVKKVAEMITPVPGGVGPVTTRVLIKNAIKAKERNK
jgi:methylenetetrahydrofolate dehydrogenase (NADP+)/methenyltetrahydrofolate cyclohydrolase